MWPRFGIKIGNSTLCIAYVRTDGKIEVIANTQGDRTSQACLLWDGRTNEIECGLTAKQKMASRPKQAVANSFQFLQIENKTNSTQLKLALNHIPCKYNMEKKKFKLEYEEPNESGESKLHVHELSAYEVQVHLLRAELELAHQYHIDKQNKPIVVLSIPSYYNESARSLLAKVAEEAGFHVAQIIAETTAALLAYNIADIPKTLENSQKFILTIKSGGIFSNFGLYEFKNELYTLQNAFGPFSLGGNNYTEALVCFICDEFQRKHKLDPHESNRSMAKIRNAAANCKHVLTTMPSTQIYIDSLMDGLDFNMQMSRARFESIIQPVIANFMQTLQDSLYNTKSVDVSKITGVVLLGATMQISKLKSAITTQFPHAEIFTSLPSDEVVAVGCARQATFLAEPEKQHFEFKEELNFAAEKVLIWHGEDESQAEVLLDKGALIPHRVLLQVPSCEKTENKEMFQVRSGNHTKPILVYGIQPNQNKMFCLEAEIAFVENEQFPLIRLRCGLE